MTIQDILNAVTLLAFATAFLFAVLEVRRANRDRREKAAFDLFMSVVIQPGHVHSLFAVLQLPDGASPRRVVRSVDRQGGMMWVTLGTSDSEYGEEADGCGSTMAWSTYDPPTYEKLMAETGFAIVVSEFEEQAGDEEYHFWVLAEAI
jgi:hypothetical protein